MLLYMFKMKNEREKKRKRMENNNLIRHGNYNIIVQNILLEFILSCKHARYIVIMVGLRMKFTIKEFKRFVNLL